MTVTSAVSVYDSCVATDGDGTTLRARTAQGQAFSLPLARWLGPPTAAEETLLSNVAAPVLDIGCGPGRHVLTLSQRGLQTLGIDISPASVSLARGRGAPVVRCSVFGDVPHAGQWATALLLDGNIGIGGDPLRLLRRARELLRPRGQLLLELDPPHVYSRRLQLVLEHRDVRSAPFPWARLATRDATYVAHETGFAIRRRLNADGRWFVCMQTV